MAAFHDRDGFIWINGEIRPWRDTNFHLLTHALHYGGAVFEGCRAYEGSIFKLTEHSQRLIDSAHMLDMKIPYTLDQINQACKDACKINGLSDAYLRPVAWRGSETMGITAKDAHVHLAVAAWSWPSYFSPEMREKGLSLGVSKWRRPSPDTAPVHAKASGLYMICTLSKHEAERAGFHDAMMLDYRGYVAEATGANLFFIRDGEVHTPLADCFLNGITRRTVIDIIRDLGIPLVERHIMPDELGSFEQCFLTGTAAEVTAVGRIGDHTYAVGDTLRHIRDAYEKLVRIPVAENMIA